MSILHAPFFPCIFLSIVCIVPLPLQCLQPSFRIAVLLFIFYFSASVCANIQNIVSLRFGELIFIQQRRK